MITTRKTNNKCFEPNKAYEAECLERKIERMREGKEVEGSEKDLHFTPAKEGAPYEYDIRGDKFDHALEIAENSNKAIEERMQEALKAEEETKAKEGEAQESAE